MRISLSINSFSVRCCIYFCGFNFWWGDFSAMQIISLLECTALMLTLLLRSLFILQLLFPQSGQQFFPLPVVFSFLRKGHSSLTHPDFLPCSLYPCCRTWPRLLHFVQTGGSARVPGKFPMQVSDDLNASHGYIDTLLSNYILLWQSSVE